MKATLAVIAAVSLTTVVSTRPFPDRAPADIVQLLDTYARGDHAGGVDASLEPGPPASGYRDDGWPGLRQRSDVGDCPRVARRVDGVLHLVLMRPAVRAYPNAPPPWSPNHPEAGGEARLENAAELTGGRVHAPIFGVDVVGTFTRAFDDFRTSYVLRYTPTGVARGGWHKIDVTVPSSPRATIRARRTYFGG